jgi:hypothetical protein
VTCPSCWCGSQTSVISNLFASLCWRAYRRLKQLAVDQVIINARDVQDSRGSDRLRGGCTHLPLARQQEFDLLMPWPRLLATITIVGDEAIALLDSQIANVQGRHHRKA